MKEYSGKSSSEIVDQPAEDTESQYEIEKAVIDKKY